MNRYDPIHVVMSNSPDYQQGGETKWTHSAKFWA